MYYHIVDSLVVGEYVRREKQLHDCMRVNQTTTRDACLVVEVLEQWRASAVTDSAIFPAKWPQHDRR